MSTFDNPFDPDRRLHASGCACGQHGSEAEHHALTQTHSQVSVASEQTRYDGVVASAVMRAMFPKDAARRAFLKSVGAATGFAALSQLFPLKFATEAFAEGGPLEKKDLKVGFIPITCATPIIMAAPMGFYSKNGRNGEQEVDDLAPLSRGHRFAPSRRPGNLSRRCRIPTAHC